MSQAEVTLEWIHAIYWEMGLFRTLDQNQIEQKLMLYMANGDTNPDNIETGTITKNEIWTTNDKTKEGTTIATTKTATTS